MNNILSLTYRINWHVLTSVLIIKSFVLSVSLHVALFKPNTRSAVQPHLIEPWACSLASTLTFSYHAAFLRVSRIKSSKVHLLQDLPVRRRRRSSLRDRGKLFRCWFLTTFSISYNAVETIFALQCVVAGFALLCTGLSLCWETFKVQAWHKPSDPSEDAGHEKVLWFFLQQPGSRCSHSGKAAICCIFCCTLRFLYACFPV